MSKKAIIGFTALTFALVVSVPAVTFAAAGQAGLNGGNISGPDQFPWSGAANGVNNPAPGMPDDPGMLMDHSRLYNYAPLDNAAPRHANAEPRHATKHQMTKHQIRKGPNTAQR